MKLHITTQFNSEDKGEGGIRRIVEAQRRYLPQLGVEIVNSINEADVVCSHAGELPEVPVGKPWVVHCHGLYWADYNWQSWAYKLNRQVIEALRQADHVTAPSEWVAYALERGMWLRPTVLRHGVNLGDWQPSRNEGYVLWNKTRVDPICDPTPVNELARLLPKVQFVSTFADSAPNVKVTGTLPFPAAREMLRGADIYLATTLETMGIGTLEAMACAIPVLGFDWGGTAEIVRHKETGYLAKPGDWADLAEGYQWLKANYEEVAIAAKADVYQHYSWVKVMEGYRQLYDRVLNQEASKNPRVSVIVTAYNLARYLPDALKSVQDQTLQDWECIVVDDHSPDNCSEIAQGFADNDKRFRVIRNETNQYLAGALNIGIGSSKGRYVLPLDADNMIDPRTLQTLSEFLDGNRRVAIAYGAMKVVKDDGRTPDDSVAPGGISSWPGTFDYLRQISHMNQIPSTCMFRREVWERTGGYRRRWRTAEDAAFWTHATSYGFRAAKATGAVTLIYRNRSDSMSHVNKEPDWTAWVPWAKDKNLLPFGAPVEWEKDEPKVPSYQPANVTVIIPVGPGHELAVIDALDSVEAQTFRNWHCIVANDTGKPLAVPHPWVTMINTDRVGPAAARNAAIAASTTSLFVPLDADDILEPKALAALLQNWQPGLGVLYSQWYDDKGEEKVSVYDPPEYDAEHLLKRGCIHAITGLYSKDAWLAVGGFDTALKNWEDWDYQIALAARGICSHKVAASLWTYRKTTGARREDAVQNYERGRQEMMAKWGKYFEGKEPLMACGACSKRAPVNSQNNVTPRQFKQDGVVYVEYIGRSATFNVIGAATGKKYRFGSDSGHRVRPVFPSDLAGLLAKSGEFKQSPNPHQQAVQSAAPVLAGR